jgi:glycosyltransferase involved in cell wall biosynthesis
LPRVSVLMPTYEQESTIARAVGSLLAQTFTDWELIIIDDGSPGDLVGAIQPYISDPRIHNYRHAENFGVGEALNTGNELAEGDYIAYLPSDDLFYPDHLATLIHALEANPDAVLAYSGVRYNYNRYAEGQVVGYPLQPVQVMHRKTDEQWVERETLVTDDWGRMYWNALQQHGTFVGTGHISCEWVWHPRQLHRLLREPEGGINPFRIKFNIRHPLRFQSTIGNMIDEVTHYRRFRERPDTPMAEDGLKIVLVGELAYNAERVLALEERGHKLYGLWTHEPQWWNTVGPLPFGHVEEVPYPNWREALEEIKPDIIYGLLNWQAVPFAHEVMTNSPDIPFVWHFKEGPFICIEKGTFPLLLDLYAKSDGQIFTNPELRNWYQLSIARPFDSKRVLVLDGDLPKQEWFTDERSPLLSEGDGEIHTVVPGRPIGLHPYVVEALAKERIHVHFYGDYTQGQWKNWIDEVIEIAPGYLHLHPHVDQGEWVREFSQYDAGWLHFFQSRNGGDLRRAVWDDLNYPARIATLAVCGLPMLQADNRPHIVAAQRFCEERRLSIFFKDIPHLGEQLRDRAEVRKVREHVWNTRHQFTFDSKADELIAYFRRIIAL